MADNGTIVNVPEIQHNIKCSGEAASAHLAQCLQMANFAM